MPKGQPQTGQVEDPAPANSSPRRRILLLALLVLLLLGGGVGYTVWKNGNSEKHEHGPDKLDGRVGDPPPEPPYCSDDTDPKHLEPLEFGPPIDIPFSRKFLDALADKEIPALEVYPWQPKGLVAVLGEHRMRGSLFALHPDGKLLAVSAGDGFIRFGGVDTFHEQHILTCPVTTLRLAWSPDGKTLASHGGDNLIRLYDVRDPAKIPNPLELEKSPGTLGSFSWSGDGKYIIGGETTAKLSSACVWEIEKRKIVNKLTHTGPVHGVAFSPVAGDYRALTAGGVEDGRLSLWNALTDSKEPSQTIEYETNKSAPTVAVHGVAFAPDGKHALSIHPEGVVRLWDLARFEKGKETHNLKGHAGVPLAGFSPDGKYIASALFGDNKVWLWDAREGKTIRPLGVSAGVSELRFLPGSERLLFAGTISNDRNLHLHDVATGKEILPPAGHLNALSCIAPSPDGRLILSGSSDLTVRLWNLDNLQQRYPSLSAGLVWGVGFHPDGKRAYHFGGSVPSLYLFDVENGQPHNPPYKKTHAGGVQSAAITRDGRYALTGGANDGKVLMWRIKDGMQVREFEFAAGQGAAVVSVAPDMRRAIRIGGTKTRLLHLRCEKVKHEWDPVSAAPFIPDGRALFLGGANSPSWKLTHEKVEEAGKFNLNLSGLSQTHLNGKGNRIAALLPGGRAAVFEIETGKELWSWTPPAHFYNVRAVALSPDGDHLLTANGDGTVYVIRLPSPGIGSTGTNPG